MANKVNSLYQEFKTQNLKSRCSVKSIKNTLRKEFRDKLKLLRNENLNALRNLSSQTNNLEIHKIHHNIAASGLTSKDIMEILEEVEKELEMESASDQCDEYERYTNDHIEYLLKEIHFCPICDKIINCTVPNTICEICSESINSA